MTIESQWAELEREARDKADPGWRLRLARPISGHPLFAAVADGRRLLLLRTERAGLPPRAEWPRSAGLEVIAVELEGHAYLGVALRETRFADVFSALAEDLARRIEAAPPTETVAVFLGQLGRWRRFLAVSAEGLGAEVQRGLWGELHTLRERLLPVIGGVAVSGWRGPTAAHQDFQFPCAWVEVKTCLAKAPQSVRVTSERQLDDTHAPALFLIVLTLEAMPDGPDTLPARVAELRAALGRWPEAGERFEESLLLAGYLDHHAPRYAAVGYAIRQSHTFRVGPGFPRIVEKNLPQGIGAVSYDLAITACAAFVVEPSELQTALQACPPTI